MVIAEESRRTYSGFIPGVGWGGVNFPSTLPYGEGWISEQYLDFASQNQERDGIYLTTF